MVRVALAATAILGVLATPATAAEPERWLGDLAFPVNLAWASDGTLFFAEKELGDVRAVSGGRVLSQPVSHVDVTVSFERGLLGLAAHPDWPDEPWLYLYYSDEAMGINRLIRIRVEDEREMERQTVLDALPNASTYHNGGDLLFGLDGMLYATIGDAHDGDRAQDPADLGGKVLRITDTGGIPSDNPFAGTRTFTLGHRNSFGLCLDPGTGDIWETENGPGGGDEVNRLVAGANYGWPVGMGPLDDERYTDPVAFYPETIVPTGCAVWRGALYVATYGDGVLRRYPLDGGEASRVHSFGEPVFDLSVGPDDRLYAATADAIWRFSDPPAGGSPDEGTVRRAERSIPAWLFPAIGVALALALLLTMRLAARRR